jgi:hypothetical protein
MVEIGMRFMVATNQPYMHWRYSEGFTPYSCNAVVLQPWDPSSFHSLPSAKLT